MRPNQAQQKVINTVEGQLLCIAVPGAGKTTSLIHRIHHMIEECGILPCHILMLTFTSAAAKEMRSRYKNMYGEDEVTFCTIHSLCLAMLCKFRGFRHSQILSDSKDVFFELMRKERRINDKESFIKDILIDISMVKNNFIDINGFTPSCTTDKELFREYYDKYETYKKERELIDFDDMLLMALDVLKEDKSVLDWMQDRYRYIQVDEYQDTNFLQRDIIYLIAGKNGNLAVVGDDDQSIYGFRGAKPEVMHSFKDDFPGCTIVHMDTNYRSAKSIIAKADTLIRQNEDRFFKEFHAFHKEQGVVEECITEQRRDQILWVMLRVKELIKKGEDPSEIAILYRTNQQAEAVASMFMEQKIEFTSNDKIPSRYKNWMFEDVRAYYRVSNREVPDKRDISRIINRPQRYLYDYEYVLAGKDLNKLRKVAFNKVPKGWKLNNTLDHIMDYFYALGRMKDADPEMFLTYMYGIAGYKNYIKEYAEFRNQDAAEFLDIWNHYVQDSKKYKTWEEWGKYIVRYNHAMEVSTKQKKGVVLSTMHSAKGLEWKHVFIIDCVEGITPYAKSVKEGLESEERRLFYVAMTRAKEHLYLCRYRERGEKEIKPSRFLNPQK